MKDDKLMVKKIESGTVIDHLRPSSALTILNNILNPDVFENNRYSILANVESSKAKQGRKDILKIECVELTPEETNKIALLSPDATINIIKNYKVVEKRKVDIPDEIIGIVKCGNNRCITNSRDIYGNRREPIDYKFDLVSRDPVILQCHYCERKIPEDGKSILDYII
ncbi:MAG: aspartate carbamoyltransferase regulatory subunit [Candidatus Aenigmarchaeota archaeon]|nr:aspartate carbamoyltransferase regulatory subunit [Candidatus Aenigmarchaeota archaeon]